MGVSGSGTGTGFGSFPGDSAKGFSSIAGVGDSRDSTGWGLFSGSGLGSSIFAVELPVENGLSSITGSRLPGSASGSVAGFLSAGSSNGFAESDPLVNASRGGTLVTGFSLTAASAVMTGPNWGPASNSGRTGSEGVTGSF